MTASIPGAFVSSFPTFSLIFYFFFVCSDVQMSRTTWFGDDFASMSLKPPEQLNPSHRSVSSNSLDKILDE